jgi:hypothetical protein
MTKKHQLNFNHAAPDLTAHPRRGTVQLSSLWAEKPLLLAFTRISVAPSARRC